MRGLCIGHASYDITLPVENFPKENTKNRIHERIECGGGPACNAAYLMAKWRMPTAFVGVIGDDYYGHKIEEELHRIGMDLTYLEKSKSARTTASYIIANITTGSRTILTSKDQNLTYSRKEIPMHPDVILVDGEELDVSRQVLLDNPEAVSVLDAGRVRESTLALGSMVTYLICSKDFAEEYTKKVIDLKDKATLISIYEQLYQDFKTNIIITLEDAGCFTKLEDYEVIPSIKVKVVDSTGAGDIFHGAFTYFIMNGYSLKQSLQLANITGAISVTRIGSRYSMPSLEEVLEVGREHAVLL